METSASVETLLRSDKSLNRNLKIISFAIFVSLFTYFLRENVQNDNGSSRSVFFCCVFINAGKMIVLSKFKANT